MGEGISFAVAKRFATEGYRIAMIARNADKLEKCKSDLHELGFESFAFVADATDAEALKNAFSEIKFHVGETDVLVYNAAVMRQGTPLQTSAEILNEDFKVNVTGALVAVQQVVPLMRAARKGTILITGGGLALQPYAGYASLAVGKAGIRSLTLMLHDELLAAGIHVATVTVAGFVQPGTHFDPDLIAEKYWQLHIQEKGKFDKEIIYN
jgi:short-subunit dehydrogenase